MIDLRPLLADTSASMIAQVHDELVVQVANSERDEVLALVERVMGGVQAPSGGPILGDVPLVASAAFGRSWAEAKAK
jgi:DNA polymerase-1